MFITCAIDGSTYGSGVNEGVGSLFEFMLSAFAVAQRGRFQFVHSDMKNIGHSSHNKIGQQEWDSQWNKYFKYMLYNLSDLPDKIKVHRIPDINLISNYICQEAVCLDFGPIRHKLHYSDRSLLTTILDKLRDNYHSSTLNPTLDLIKCYFDPKKINIAVHIRRYTNTDSAYDSSRDFYAPNNYMQPFFTNVIKRLQVLKPGSVVHIYSQGRTEDFSSFHNFQLHLDEHPITTLHHMIKADILVMSKSAFSNVACAYSKGIKLMRCNPITPILSEVKLIPIDGTSFDL